MLDTNQIHEAEAAIGATEMERLREAATLVGTQLDQSGIDRSSISDNRWVLGYICGLAAKAAGRLDASLLAQVIVLDEVALGDGGISEGMKAFKVAAGHLSDDVFRQGYGSGWTDYAGWTENPDNPPGGICRRRALH